MRAISTSQRVVSVTTVGSTMLANLSRELFLHHKELYLWPLLVCQKERREHEATPVTGAQINLTNTKILTSILSRSMVIKDFTADTVVKTFKVTVVVTSTWWFTLDLSTSAVLVHMSRSSGTLMNFEIIRKCILTWASFSAKRRTVRTAHTQPRKLCSSTNKYIQTRFSLVMCAKRSSKQKDICNNIFGFMTRTS